MSARWWVRGHCPHWTVSGSSVPAVRRRRAASSRGRADRRRAADAPRCECGTFASAAEDGTRAQPMAAIMAGHVERRGEPEDETGDRGGAQREREDHRVDRRPCSAGGGDRSRPAGTPSGDRRSPAPVRAERRTRQGQRRRRRRQRQHDAFGQQLPDDSAAAGAERTPDGDLALARRAAGEQEVGHIGADDQQHDADRRDQHPQGRADQRHLCACIVTTSNRFGEPEAAGDGSPKNCCPRRSRLGPGFLDRYSGLDLREDAEQFDDAGAGRAGDERRPERGLSGGKVEIGAASRRRRRTACRRA